MEGKVFGRLLVVNYAYTKNRNKYWNCMCDCGNKHTVMATSLRRKNRPTRSCGCLQREMTSSATGRVVRPKGETCCWSLYLTYKRRSKKRNLDFKIAYETFKVITKQNCYYCGVEPSQIHELNDTNGGYIYNGIDRLDSKIGYLDNNVKPCCKACNYAKRVMSEKEFYKWIERVYSYTKLKRRRDV